MSQRQADTPATTAGTKGDQIERKPCSSVPVAGGSMRREALIAAQEPAAKQIPAAIIHRARHAGTTRANPTAAIGAKNTISMRPRPKTQALVELGSKKKPTVSSTWARAT